ncbi:MAG: cohesin domain-containing protein, partial [Candidatus Marinimicrobia bacterium]|nr:cohesin domain-containing protein [Candidatus Neomarinimicrobiota bacterium]
MKNILQLCLPLLLFGLSLQAEPIGLRIPDSTVTAGDIVDIPVYVDSSLDGSAIYAYRLQLQFNAAKMQVLSAQATGTVTENFGDPTINTGITGNVVLAGAGATPLSGSGILFYIRFEMLLSGGTTLAFTGAEENYFNEGSPEIIFDNGYIVIDPLILPSINVYPDSRTMLVGDSLQFSVSGAGTAPYTWSVTDESVASITEAGLLHAVDRGFTRVRVADAVGLSDSTTGLVEVLNLTLQLPDTSVWQGDTVDIPITYQELSEIDILSGQFYLSYYSDRFTVLEVIQTGTLLEDFPAVVFHNSAGRTDLAFAGNTPVPGSGILMILRIHSIPGNTSSSPISFNQVVFNEDILAQVDDGYLTVLKPPGLGITPTYSSPLTAGDTLRFNGVGGIPPYSYETSNTGVASIDADGLMTALHSGSVFVTVSDAFGSSQASSSIQIYDTWVSFPDTSAVIGLNFDMPLMIDQLPAGEMINAIEATFSYRGPELVFMEIISAETFTEGWSFTQVIDGNMIQIAGAGTNGFSQAGTILKLRFMLTDEYYIGESAYVRIQELLLNEGSPLARTRDGSILGLEANLPPEITSPESVIAIEDEPFVYQATATDPESDPLNYAFSGLPDWLTAQADSVYGSPGEGVLTGSFLLSVSDGQDLDTQTVSITVTPVNDAPQLTSPDFGLATEDIMFVYHAAATDPEDSTLAFSFEALPAWMTADADSVLGIPYEGAQDTSFTTIVTDGALTDTLQVNISIQAVNDPPELTSSDAVDATEDQYFVYLATATDPEADSLSYEFSELPDWLTAGADSIYGSPGEGTLEASFQVSVTDDEFFDTLMVTITVTPVNDPPVINSLSEVTAQEDVVFGYRTTALDPEDSTLIFSFEDLPSWLLAAADSVSGIPLEGAVDTSFTAIVFDGELGDTLLVQITVGSSNDPPQIVMLSDTTMVEDDTLRIVLQAFDVD